MSAPRSFLRAVVLLALFGLRCGPEPAEMTAFKVGRCGAEPLVSPEDVVYAARFDPAAMVECIRARDKVLLNHPPVFGRVP